MKKITVVLVVVLILTACGPSLAIEGRTYKLREDMGAEPLYDGLLQYYYYIPGHSAVC